MNTNEQVKQKAAGSVVGNFFKVNDGLVQVIGYNGNKRVQVRFESGYETTTTMTNIKTGEVKDRFKPTISGVGYVGNPKTKGEERRKLYLVWRNMILRVTDAVKFPDYKDVTVCDRWLCFENFVDDVKNLVGYERFMQEKYIALDKDIRCPIGSPKQYSPERCMWITQAENTIQMTKEREQRRAQRRPSLIPQRVQVQIDEIAW